MPDVRQVLPLDFCLEGFRLIRQRPYLIAFWGTITLFGNAVAILLAVALSGPAIQSLATAATRAPLPPDLLLLLLQAALPGVAAFLAISAVTASVVTAAVCRAVAGDSERLGFLQFGMREIRLCVVNLTMLVFSLAIILACFIVAGIPAALFTTVPGAMSAFAALATLAAAGLVFWLRVRLSLNVPQTFATQRIDIFGSFKLTRDLFRQLAFGYAGAFALAIVVELLCAQVTGAILMLIFGDITKPDLATLTAFLTPANTVDLVLTHLIVSPLVAAILYGAPVSAYARISGQIADQQVQRV